MLHAAVAEFISGLGNGRNGLYDDGAMVGDGGRSEWAQLLYDS